MLSESMIVVALCLCCRLTPELVLNWGPSALSAALICTACRSPSSSGQRIFCLAAANAIGLVMTFGPILLRFAGFVP